MKKLFLCAATVAAIMSCTAYAETLAHMEGDGGIVDVTGYDIVEKDDKIILEVFARWENTTDKNDRPSSFYSFKGFQNGKQLDAAWLLESPEGYDSRMTEIQPGYSIDFYDCFKLEDYSPVDMDVHDFFNTNDKVEFTIDPSNIVKADVQPDEPVSDEPDAPTVAEVIQSLEQRIADLEARMDAMEGK